MFTIDFTKPFLYKDIIYFNQGNLAANNILRCKLATGGDETLKGYIATVTFKTLSHAEINGSVDIVDDKNCIVDIKFPSNALEVGVNELEVILSKGEGADKVVTPSPIIKYEVWQCITTGNGIQGDSNYPILIDLISDVNNAVRIANNASATADVSLKQTAKMLEVVNANIAKANEAIDNTNSAKDEALNAVEEVNSAKDNLISEVNAAKNSMIEDVNSTKNTVVADVNQAKNDMKITVDEAIKFLKQEFNSLTAQQQEELEMLQARDGEVNLNARLERDLAKGKMHWETVEGSYISTDDTLDSYLQNIEIKGNTIQNLNNLSDIKSVGDKVGDEELYKIPIKCCGKNLFDKTKVIKGSIIPSNGEEVSSDTKLKTPFIKIQGVEKINISGISSDNYVYYYDSDKNYIKSHAIGFIENTVSNAKYIKVIYGVNDNLDSIQVEEGTQSSPYEPYKEHKITILSPVPIEKVGDIADRIIEKDGVWGVEKNIVDEIFNGSESWMNAWDSSGNTIGFYISRDNGGGHIICDKFKSTLENIAILDEECVSFPENAWIGVRINKSKLETANITGFKKFLTINNIMVKYPTAKPQFIPLPHAQQIKLKTFANKTNISFECEVEGTIKADVAKSISASVNSNTKEIGKINNRILDLEGLKESQEMAYSTDKGYLVCKETKAGTVKDLKIYGKSLLLNSENVEVLPGVEGATIKSVGIDVDKIEVSSCSKIDYTYSNSYGSRNDYTLLNALLTGCNIINKSDKSIVAQVYSSNTQKWIRDDNVSPNENYIIKEGEYCPIITLYTSRGWQLKEEKLERFVFISTQKQDKKTLLFKDEDGVWKPITELRGLPTTCDTVELHNDGKYYYHQRTEKEVIDGSDKHSIIDGGINDTVSRFVITSSSINHNKVKLSLLCDKFNALDDENAEGIFLYPLNHNRIDIRIGNSKIPTQNTEGFKQYLQSNPVTVVYQLAEEKVFEVNPLFLEAYEGETTALINSGVINAPIEFKMSSYISNLVLLNQKRIKELENEIYKSQDIQDMMILENDLRLMDIEFALMESMPIKLNLRSDNMFKGVTEFEFLKGRILSGNHTDEYLEKCINKYKKAGRLTEEEYDTLYDMIYPPVYDILAEK